MMKAELLDDTIYLINRAKTEIGCKQYFIAVSSLLSAIINLYKLIKHE